MPSRRSRSTASSGPASAAGFGASGRAGPACGPWKLGGPRLWPVIGRCTAPVVIGLVERASGPARATCSCPSRAVDQSPSSPAIGHSGVAVATTTAAARPGPAPGDLAAEPDVQRERPVRGQVQQRGLRPAGVARPADRRLVHRHRRERQHQRAQHRHEPGRRGEQRARAPGGRRAPRRTAPGTPRRRGLRGLRRSGRSVSGAAVTRASSRTPPTIPPRSARPACRRPSPRRVALAATGILDRRGRPTSGGPGEVGVLASSTRSRTRSLGLVGLAIVGSGLLVNAYLAIIARNISAAEYAYFGAFWSLALVAGFGVFLPIEQETARLLQVPDRPRGLLRAALLTALSLAVVQVVLVAAAAPWLAHAFGGHGVSVVAFAVLCLISAGQFVVRGALVGMDRMDRYALVMVLDTLFRVVFAAAVALARRRPRQLDVRLDARRRRRPGARPSAVPARHPPRAPGHGARDGHAHRHRRRGAPRRRPAAARLAVRAAAAQRPAGADPRARDERGRDHPGRAVHRGVHPRAGAAVPGGAAADRPAADPHRRCCTRATGRRCAG